MMAARSIRGWASSAVPHDYSVLPLTRTEAVRAFLDRDRALTAYMLGDLDPALWPESEFLGALCRNELAAVVLLYRGLDPTIITAYGEPDGVRAVLDAVPLPREMYTLMPPGLGEVIHAYYMIPDPHTEWRMVLDADAFRAPALTGVQRILPEHADLLAALYHMAAGPGEEIVAFSPAQIARGVFYGVWRDGALVATAGTHIWSQAERVAAVGNVFTHPAWRGRGYATRCTGAVVRDALTAGMDPVVLNVAQDNAAAIRVYEGLGFRRYAAFTEGPGLRKGV